MCLITVHNCGHFSFSVITQSVLCKGKYKTCENKAHLGALIMKAHALFFELRCHHALLYHQI